MDLDKLETIVLTGTPLERGRIHGETLREKIADAVGTWGNLIEKEFRLGSTAFVEQFLRDTDFASAIEKWTPDLLDEVRGIAEGSGQDFSTIFAFQFFDESGWYAIRSGLGLPLHGTERCSAIGVCNQGDYPTVVGQNMDLPSWTDGNQVLLHIKEPNSPVESVIASLAGMLATTGMNNQGIGLGVNALVELSPNPSGLPVPFIVRGMLQQPTFAKAVNFVKQVPHASGQNYLIGGPGEVQSYECSGNKVVQYQSPAPNLICHTNHVLVNDDRGMYEEVLAALDSGHGFGDASNSRTRQATIERLIIDSNVDVGVTEVRNALSSCDHAEFPVCRDTPTDDFGFSGLMTVFSTVCELSSEPRMHYCPGPPNKTEFQAFSF